MWGLSVCTLFSKRSALENPQNFLRSLGPIDPDLGWFWFFSIGLESNSQNVLKHWILKNNHSVSGLGPNWLLFCTYIYKVNYLWHLSKLSDLPVHPGLSSWMASMQHCPSSNITGPWLHASPHMHPALRWSKWLVLWQVT